MHPPIDSKLPRVGTTIFTVMSRLAAEHGAINLSQGFPDFDPPERLLELANEHMRRGGAGNQYAPMVGLPQLREAIAAKVAEYYDARVDPDAEVTVTAGGTEALFCAIQAIVRHGDEVVLLDPAYDSYQPAIELAGGVAIHVPLQRPGFGHRLAATARRNLVAHPVVDPEFSAQPQWRHAYGRRPGATRRAVARYRRVRACRRSL